MTVANDEANNAYKFVWNKFEQRVYELASQSEVQSRTAQHKTKMRRVYAKFMTTIPKEFTHELLSRIDIAEIIGLRIKLKKTGSNYSALCPFHSEKTPSFTVSPAKQFFHCFGCGAHGNAINFLMQYENLEFVAAVETLANHIGIEIPKNEIQKKDDFIHKNLYALLAQISDFYQKELRQAEIAIKYLKQRGLTGVICKHFSIGYAPNSWENLESIAKKDNNIEKQLLTAGMLIEKKERKRLYSRFRHRIMIPIKDNHGNVIAFGGRSLDNNSLPKYLNSPETPIFHKRNELFGLYEAKKANKNLEQIIVVEGYLDVISLVQFEITNVVASLGTAITTNQIQNLLRYTSSILFCFDGDKAGKAAAFKAMQICLPLMREGIKTSFLFLPEKEDPDSLIRKIGKSRFLNRAKNATPLSDFFFQKITDGKNIQSAEDSAEIARIAQENLQKMPNGIYKQLLLKKLSELLKIETSYSSKFDYLLKANPRKDRLAITQKPKDPRLLAISLLLNAPHLAHLVDCKENFEGEPEAYCTLLLELINLAKSQHNLTVGAILEYYRDSTHFELLNNLLSWEPLLTEEDLKNEFLGVIQLIKKSNAEKAIQDLLQKATNFGLTDEDKIKLQKLIAIAKQQ